MTEQRERHRLKASYAGQPLAVLRAEYRNWKEVRDRHVRASRDTLAAMAQMRLTVITEEVEIQKGNKHNDRQTR